MVGRLFSSQCLNVNSIDLLCAACNFECTAVAAFLQQHVNLKVLID